MLIALEFGNGFNELTGASTSSRRKNYEDRAHGY